MALRKLFSAKNLVSFVKNASVRPIATSAIRAAHVVETDVEFDQRYEKYFSNPELDGWMLRKGINDLQGYDLVPEPKIITSVLHACRRVNDYALAVRFLEAVKDKCGPKVKTIWPYLLTEIKPTLDELGVLTPEEMGYDKPELACKSVWDM